MQVSEGACERDGGGGLSPDITDCRSLLRWIGAGWAQVLLLSVVQEIKRGKEAGGGRLERAKVEGRIRAVEG